MRTQFWSEMLKKRALWRPMVRWEDNIKIDLREMWWERVDWTRLAQKRDRWRAFLNTVMNLRIMHA